MDENNNSEQVTTILNMIQILLTKSLDIQQEDKGVIKAILDQDTQQTQTTVDLLHNTELTNGLASERTDLAKERTDLVRKQTQLSTRSTELSVIRTDMSRERSGLAGQRTDMSVFRTDLSRSRTGLADQRTKMANHRTQYSLNRTTMAGSRTILSNIRTSLAQGRTDLALIRTGLAFLTIAIAFYRLFGLSRWTLFDGLLALASVTMTAFGLTGYLRATNQVKVLKKTLNAQEKVIT